MKINQNSKKSTVIYDQVYEKFTKGNAIVARSALGSVTEGGISGGIFRSRLPNPIDMARMASAGQKVDALRRHTRTAAI